MENIFLLFRLLSFTDGRGFFLPVIIFHEVYSVRGRVQRCISILSLFFYQFLTDPH